MNDFLRFAFTQRATGIWLALVAATGLSWWMGTGALALEAQNSQWMSTALIAVAVIKSRLVLAYFMEVRHAGIILRVVTDVWCVGVLVTLTGLYWNLF